MGGIAGKRPRVAARCGATDDAASPPRRLRRERALDDGARTPDAFRCKDGGVVGGAGIDYEPVSAGTESDDDAVSVATDTGDEAVSADSSLGSEEEEEATNYSSAEELFVLSDVDDFSAGFDCYRQDISSNRSAAELAASTSNVVKPVFSSTIDAQITHGTGGKEEQITYGNAPQVSSSTSSTAKLAAAADDAKIGDGSSQVMIEVKKAAAAAALNESKKGEGIDDTKKSKGPLFSLADLEAKRAMAQVKHLHFEAMQSKEKMPPVRASKSKIDQIHSAIEDRAMLVIQAKDDTTGQLSSCSQHEFINRKCGVCRKKEGIDLIMWKGKMAIPSSSLTGNRFVDEMNAVLFGLYGSITCLLKKSNTAYSCAGLGVEDRFSVKKDTKDALFLLRKTTHDIRRLILEMGGLLLREPVEHWKGLHV